MAVVFVCRPNGLAMSLHSDRRRLRVLAECIARAVEAMKKVDTDRFKCQR